MFEPGLSLLLPDWLSSYIILHNNTPQINVSGDQGFFKFHSRTGEVPSSSPGQVNFFAGHLTFKAYGFLGNSNYRRIICNQSCSSKLFFTQVEMTFGLVHVSCILPEWQAIKLTFFAPC